MRLQVARALVQDALYQVLDNKVFRVLVVVTCVLVLFPLLVAFRKEEIVVLFGFESYTYEGFFEAMGPFFGFSPQVLGALTEFELRDLAVETYQGIISDGVMGFAGVMLCLAATAFFVPHMIEKGTADTVFSKPVSRLSLLLARYLTGIFFVGILSTLLIAGSHLTLLLASGYSDAGFLWTIPALIYKFGIVYAFTMLVAVLTRSTVTSLILTILFVPANGCVHLIWNVEQMNREILAETLDEETLAQREEQVQKASPALGGVVDGLFTLLRGLHYSLPKTDDALTIAERLRDLVGGGGHVFALPDLEFTLLSLPEGFEPVGDRDSAWLDELSPTVEGDAIVYSAGWKGRTDEASFVIRRRVPLETPIGSSGRFKVETARRAADLFEDWIEDGEDDGLALVSEDNSVLADRTLWRRFVRELQWTAERPDGAWAVRSLLLKEQEAILTFQLQTREGWLAEHPEVREHFAGRDYRFGSEQVGREHPGAWYQAKLDWDAPWRFNIFFSIGSSLGFVALMIALAWWRLARMDF